MNNTIGPKAELSEEFKKKLEGKTKYKSSFTRMKDYQRKKQLIY